MEGSQPGLQNILSRGFSACGVTQVSCCLELPHQGPKETLKQCPRLVGPKPSLWPLPVSCRGLTWGMDPTTIPDQGLAQKYSGCGEQTGRVPNKATHKWGPETGQVQEVSAGVPRPRGAGREHQDKGTSAAGGLLPSFQFLFLARLGGSGPARTPGGSLRSPRYPASPGTPASPACAASVQPARPGPAPRHVRPGRAHSHRDAMNCSPAAVRTPPSCRPPSRGYRSGPRGLRFGDCGTRTLEDPP